MSKVSDVSEIESVLQDALRKGKVEDHYLKELKAMAEIALNNVHYQALLSGNKTIIKERELVLQDDKVLKPDQIILREDCTILVDFKTGIEKPQDIDQVEQYKEVLKQMGLPNVSGYLFYIEQNQLKGV